MPVVVTRGPDLGVVSRRPRRLRRIPRERFESASAYGLEWERQYPDGRLELRPDRSDPPWDGYTLEATLGEISSPADLKPGDVLEAD